MACPHVAGTAALVLAGPGGDVRTILQDTADDLGNPGWDKWYGFGLVDADEAADAPAGPPATDFMGDPLSGDKPLTVQFMDISIGDITSWSWNFGDGGNSADRDPSHEYVIAGSYTVSLTVTGPGGSDTETKTNYINVSTPDPPAAAFSGSPTSGKAPLAVQFTDQSTGSISGWSWAFGDGGSSAEQNPSHTYDNAGDYTVSLTVTGSNSDTETKTNYIEVTAPPAPTVVFSGSPTSGDAPLTVLFTIQSTGSITSWSWTFGDGGISTEQSPSHTYQDSGVYTVSLTVTGPGGSDNETKTGYITVTAPPPPPVADFMADKTSGDAPLTVLFTDLSTETITSWSWDFGDGETSTQQDPSHNYLSAGSYTVSLTITGPGGSDTETKAKYINVTSSGPTEVFFDSFESYYDWNANWSQDSQNDWRRRIARSIEGNYAAEVDGRASDSQLISAPIDLHGKQNATITFWWYIESGLDAGEYLAFDISADGGAWKPAASLRGDVDQEDAWHNMSIDVTGINNIKIRFRATMSGSSEDAYVDVVKVVAW
jgi:PKD repeat protein